MCKLFVRWKRVNMPSGSRVLNHTTTGRRRAIITLDTLYFYACQPGVFLPELISDPAPERARRAFKSFIAAG
jgi:hypothetical protein